MKIFKYTTKGVIILTTLCLFAQGSFAYAPATTHAGLTQEILAYYEIAHGETFTDEFSELVIQASIDEDNPSTRALNHFNDPIHGTGINDYRTSYDWATNEFSGNDFRWSEGVAAYANGDERKAMIVLGHVLHLLEDSSVPDHTRNDPHIGHGLGGLYTGASPFEDWTDTHKDRDTLRGVGQVYYEQGLEKNNCMSVRECFDFIALYSNQNFFSADTIGSIDYTRPVQSRSDKNYGYGVDEFSQKEVKLFSYKIDRNDIGTPVMVKDSDYSVVSEYFDRLAPQVVGVGARVIDLYMNEAKLARAERLKKDAEAHAKAVAEQTALNARMQNKGIFGQLAFGFGDLFLQRPASFVANTGHKLALVGGGLMHGYTVTFDSGFYATRLIAKSGVRGGTAVLDKTQEAAVVSVTHATVLAQKTEDRIQSQVTDLGNLIQQLMLAREALSQLAVAEVSRSDTQSEAVGASNDDVIVGGEVLGASTVAAPSYTPTYSLGGGGGGGGGGNTATVIFLSDAAASAAPVIPEATTTADEVAPIDVVAPDAPVILAIVSQIERDTFQSQGVTFGNDALPFHLATTTVVISGTAEAGAIVQCSWLFDAATIVFETRATTMGEWSSTVLLPPGTTTIGVVAIDAIGNVSSSTMQIIVVTLPAPPVVLPEREVSEVSRVIINEIAWSGTNASSSDEWLELYNAGDGEADLSLYYIEIGEGGDKASIPLSGTIGAGEYVVVMKDGALHSSGPAMTASGLILPDGGAELALVETTDDGATVHDTVPFCADWCGKGGAGLSMERWRLDYEGDLESNWGTNDDHFRNGLDRDGNLMHGTPGERNSMNYRLSLSNTLLGMHTFAKGLGAYVIFETLTVPNGSSLTLGAGTVVKINSVGEPKLMVNGALVALGTASQPVIFTALGDDSVGGDTMQDGTLAPSLVPRFHSVNIIGASSTADLTNTEFHHATAALFLNNGASTTLASTTITDGRTGIVVSRSALVSDDLLLDKVTSTGINASNGASLALASTTIRNSEGGGISVGVGVHMELDGLVIRNLGGGISLRNSFATATDMLIDGTSGRSITMSGFSTLELSSSTISNSSFVGIDIQSSTLHAQNISLVNNQRGIVSSRGVVEIHDSIIAGNMLAGITNATPSVGAPLDATGNYWGDADGPTLPNMTIGSAGDSVSAGVLAEPFLAVAPE